MIMIKVDEIYPFDINSTIGPTGTIKRLFRNRDYLIERGYDMAVFAVQKAKSRLFMSKKELTEISILPENKISAKSVSKEMSRWISLIKSRKHAFVESNYITSALAFYKASRYNAQQVKAYLKMGRTPDIVVFHELDSCYHYCRYRKNKKSKVVVFIHADGSDTEMFLKRKPKLKGSRECKKKLADIMFVYEQCDCIVWISELAKKRFCDNHPEYAYKTIAVVNGIDDIPKVDAVASTNHTYRLVCTGTVCERKGQYIIVEAMHRMDPDVLKNTHLTIIGTGPDYSRLVNLSSTYGLQEHITFLGNVPNSEVHELLCKENIYVLMSNNEGLPISILEAMRAGLPVISTHVAGIPEEVDDRNGILIDPEINQLTEVLNVLPTYDWKNLGKASRLRFEKEFTFDIMRCHYADMFDNLFK